LLDPWARAVDASLWSRARAAVDASAPGIRGRVLPADGYDWQGDSLVAGELADAVIYELHVGGFTRGARVDHPGSFAALIDQIPYLQALGVTHVELLPVMAFDEQDVPAGVAARGLSNFWGYSTYGFYAPHPGYAVTDDPRREFRDMVRALHESGIGVIMDVVFNHTAEGGEGGPVINFKGLGNEFFYHLDPADRRRYRDYTGTGNTVNCNHPLVARFIIDCLEYWARDMHVDGFRLDLASVLARGEDGQPMEHPPVLWAAEFSTALAGHQLIAEAWDAAGMYQVGEFPGFRWSEWNGDYRDTVRRAVRAEHGLRGRLASRIAGSSDLYRDDGRLPTNSINFVTCHDGFTLADLVSYAHKHNMANGEDNRDGSDHDFSWNCGEEGPTDDPDIQRLRAQQQRNFLAVLLVSQGVPMLLAGDECGRSQRGNNNAWCQDNPIGWFDWTEPDGHADLLRFTRGMIALRARHPALRRRRFLTGKPSDGNPPDIAWFDENGDPPDWQADEACRLAFRLAGVDEDEPDLFVAMNFNPESASFKLPDGRWRPIVRTDRASPADIRKPRKKKRLRGSSTKLRGHSLLIAEQIDRR
jgi:glycogen operon protein